MGRRAAHAAVCVLRISSPLLLVRDTCLAAAVSCAQLLLSDNSLSDICGTETIVVGLKSSALHAQQHRTIIPNQVMGCYFPLISYKHFISNLQAAVLLHPLIRH